MEVTENPQLTTEQVDSPLNPDFNQTTTKLNEQGKKDLGSPKNFLTSQPPRSAALKSANANSRSGQKLPPKPCTPAKDMTSTSAAKTKSSFSKRKMSGTQVRISSENASRSSSSNVKKINVKTSKSKLSSKGRSISLSNAKESPGSGQKRSQSKGGNSDGGRVTGFDPDNLELPIHTIKYGGSSMGNASAADSAEHLEIKRCESAVQADFFSSDGERNSNDNMMEPKSAVIRPEGTLTTPSQGNSNQTEATMIITEEESPIYSRNNMISSDPSSAHFNNSLSESDDEQFKARTAIDIKKIFANEQFPDAVPVMARQTNYIDTGPPKCPLEQVKFIELKKFRVCQAQIDNMNSGFNLVDDRRKLRELRQLENKDKGPRSRHGSPDSDSGKKLIKMDNTTHYIKNVVYARDPTIIDRETMRVNQRDAFSHENNLDVKKMIQKREELNAIKMAAVNSNMPKIRWQNPKQSQQSKPPVVVKPPMEPQIHQLEGENDKTLMFESRFESGNLYLAQKVNDQEYNLLMQNDINTNGHTQWFFFRVTNTKPGLKVKFNVLNYSKPDSLFNYGMKVSIYSDKQAELNNVGWHKGGEDISYFNNGIRKEIIYSSKSFYTATFTYKFKHADDSVFFAYAQPYSYSDLRCDLDLILNDPERKQFITSKVLCQTLSGTQCEYLTITSKKKSNNKDPKEEKKADKKPGVIISARVHPGETVGSHMMKGVLLFLTDFNNPEAQLLRENFVFKVIPMLNPDGVINGNYRCSLAGCDLNRRWKAPSKQLHPTIYYTKKLIKQVHEERGVVMFCDLHGHSRKQNVFMYGCHKKENPGICRIFPYLLSKMNPYFIFEESRFGVQKSKESTARVAMFKELNRMPCVFTMESSFAGMDRGKHEGVHFTDLMLMTLGTDLCRSILAYHNIYIAEELRQLPMFQKLIESNKAKDTTDSSLIKLKWQEDEKIKTVGDIILAEFSGNKKLLEHGLGDSTSGSDDLPSEDNLPVEDLSKQLPETKTIKQCLKKALKDKAEAKKKEIEEEAIKKKEEIKAKRAEALKVKNEPPRPLPRKPYVRVPLVKDKKGEGIDMHTQTDRSYVSDMKAKLADQKAQIAERTRLSAQLQKEQLTLLQTPQIQPEPIKDIIQVKRDPGVGKPPMTNPMRSPKSNVHVPENLMQKPQLPAHNNPFTSQLQNKEKTAEMQAAQAQQALSTGVNFHNYMSKQPPNAIKQMVNRQSPTLMRATAPAPGFMNPNNLSPKGNSAGTANREMIWNTNFVAPKTTQFKAGTQQQQQHQGFLKLQQHRAAQLDGMVTTSGGRQVSPRLSAQTDVNQITNNSLQMTGTSQADHQHMQTTHASPLTNSSLQGATSPSRQELSSASAMAISHSKNQRAKIGIEGSHMTGIEYSQQSQSPMTTNQTFESINDQRSEQNFSMAPTASNQKPPQSGRNKMSPTARSLPSSQQKQGFLANAQSKNAVQGESKTRQNTPSKDRTTSGNKMRDLRQVREAVTAESQLEKSNTNGRQMMAKPPMQSPGKQGSAKMNESGRKYMASPRTQKLQQPSQQLNLNPIATQNGVKRRQDGSKMVKMQHGEEMTHISSRSSDPNSRRMVRGPDEQANNNGETISIAGLVGMNLSASINTKNKYRTNSLNNTAGRTFGGGHFEGLQGMQPSTKLPNLDYRHQPKDVSEIQLQNKLPQTPAPSIGKFNSTYASPIRTSAQGNIAEQYDPRFSTETRNTGPQGPPFTRTSHTEKKRYNQQLGQPNTAANLVQITRQEEEALQNTLYSPTSKFRAQAAATQQNRQWNNQTEPSKTTYQPQIGNTKMQVMVPNANGTLLGGSIVPGRQMIGIAEANEMGSPQGLRRANFKPATSTTLQQSDDDTI